MKEFSSGELKEIKGGGMGLIIGFGTLIVIIAGIFDGFSNPNKCND